jgi:hypothetical protein
MYQRIAEDRDDGARHRRSRILAKVARLGGYLARAKDPPPGNVVMWRGLSRFTEVAS